GRVWLRCAWEWFSLPAYRPRSGRRGRRAVSAPPPHRFWRCARGRGCCAESRRAPCRGGEYRRRTCRCRAEAGRLLCASFVSRCRACWFVPTFLSPAVHSLRRCLDRCDDILIAGAAAQIAAQPFADLQLARIRNLLQERFGGEENSRRAKAALQSVQLPEFFLKRMQLGCVWREAFHGFQRGAVRLHGEEQAGAHRLA